jgi:hypothetical protein
MEGDTRGYSMHNFLCLALALAWLGLAFVYWEKTFMEICQIGDKILDV